MGSLGWPEIMVILVIALIIFGPRKLPQLGKTLGKALGEFRRATNDLKNTLEVEVSREEEKLSSGDRRKAEDAYSRPTSSGRPRPRKILRPGTRSTSPTRNPALRLPNQLPVSPKATFPTRPLQPNRKPLRLKKRPNRT